MLLVRRAVNLKERSFGIGGRCFKSTLPDDYQFIQKAALPMLHFQASLPRLPVPKLEQTAERYLSALKPLLSDSDHARVSAIVAQFTSTDGPKLQSMLVQRDKAESHTSYISAPWFDMYLRDRQPLPINYNPLLVLKPHDRPEMNNQRSQAINYIISSLRFMRALRSQTLGPEVYHINPKKTDTDRYRRVMRMTPNKIATYVSYMFKAYPLDMSQYPGLFAATRIPEIGKDRIFRATPEQSRHILILRNGFMYVVDVLDKDGNIEAPAVITQSIDAILSSTNSSAVNEHPLGYLTAENRDTWARERSHLEGISEANKTNFSLIDSALFCVCLDDVNVSFEDTQPMVRQHLFENAGNRWFDKSFSLVIGKDGTSSVNFEHSWGDGVAVMRYCTDVYNDVTKNAFIMEANATSSSTPTGKVRRLEFNLDDKSKEGIGKARENHERISKSLDLNIFQQMGLGKRMCKTKRVSPDCIMQLGMQLAHYKLHGRFVSTYESCSTAAFRHGRTETMRPCTIHTKEFCEKAEVGGGQTASPSDMQALIHKCSQYHGELTKNAAMGQGFDRHLFGLKHTAQINELAMPELFQDDTYRLINYNILSTSTLSSPIIVAGGFGPVVHDGFGLGYGIQDESLGVVVTSYAKHQSGSDMVQALSDSYRYIERCLS